MEAMDYIWLGVVILAAVVEAAVPQLVSIWFVPAGLLALVASLCGAPLWLQIVIFLAGSVLALALTRPLVKKLQGRKQVSTNADMAIGKTALVTEDINNILATGRASVMGNSWSARSVEADGIIPKGSRVVVERIEGVKLMVRRMEETTDA